MKTVQLLPDDQDLLFIDSKPPKSNDLQTEISKAYTYLNLFIKRTLDLLMVAVFMLFIGFWLFPIIALIIKLDSKGPVFFKQLRHGKDNKPFYCYKFRSMVINKSADTQQATKNDPRITKVGKIIRKTSIDELPQLINVLKGEMSIVGPRPHPLPLNLEFSTKIDGFMDRHQFKPGLTGLAQARGFRGETAEFHQMYSRYKLDVLYLKKWSPWLDIKIIWMTAKSLISKTENAY
ncbi:sugar transferase [Belliella kenyensis]|uniref:Sugar transferase n=1 Tax=Belliella kenyensis TaxID=1472724 RepID=A0ABV8ELM4_9BACT|nr:sugar transferase [Belliella kenyensis]MCH7400522.1 sugar transferase [Belliella kenyensis]MDN3604462.1 sugar transferase [Belliella kenyensis]